MSTSICFCPDADGPEHELDHPALAIAFLTEITGKIIAVIKDHFNLLGICASQAATWTRATRVDWFPALAPPYIVAYQRDGRDFSAMEGFGRPWTLNPLTEVPSGSYLRQIYKWYRRLRRSAQTTSIIQNGFSAHKVVVLGWHSVKGSVSVTLKVRGGVWVMAWLRKRKGGGKKTNSQSRYNAPQMSESKWA